MQEEDLIGPACIFRCRYACRGCICSCTCTCDNNTTVPLPSPLLSFISSAVSDSSPTPAAASACMTGQADRGDHKAMSSHKARSGIAGNAVTTGTWACTLRSLCPFAFPSRHGTFGAKLRIVAVVVNIGIHGYLERLHKLGQLTALPS
jgi:hypothetical protein